MEQIRDILEREGFEAKAIPTQYRGVKYRSRLEARWAVFLDHLCVEHHYEFEGFDLSAGWYLPDFWLPGLKMWLEIKGKDPTSEERKLCEQLCVGRRERVCLANGPPTQDMWMTAFVPDEASDDGCWEDEPFQFCACPKCGRIGVAFNGWGDRVCPSCCPERDRRGWNASLEEASREAMTVSFWNPR